MTRKQIEARKDAIYFTVYGNGMRVGKWNQFTKSQKSELEELSCREMINSSLIYNGHILLSQRKGYSYQQYILPYESKVGRNRLNELIDEQIEDFKKAEVGYAGCDSEGCSYNYCKWADD